jgi:hypothetical protein
MHPTQDTWAERAKVRRTLAWLDYQTALLEARIAELKLIQHRQRRTQS